MILLMYEAGLRRQEVIDLKKEDIDLKNGIISIYHNGKFDRLGYISKLTTGYIEDYLEEWEYTIDITNEKRRDRVKRKGGVYIPLTDSEYLFQTVRSPQVSYAVVYKTVKDATFEYYLNQFVGQGINGKNAETMAEEKTKNVDTETFRHSRRAYYFSEGHTVEKVQMLMGDENFWVCKRYMKLAQQLYPERFRG